jgi:hypothetical protein
MGRLGLAKLVALLVLKNGSNAWITVLGPSSKRSPGVSTGPSTDIGLIPDGLVFPRGQEDELRIKVQNFAFEFRNNPSSGSTVTTTSTAMKGSIISPEYVEAERGLQHGIGQMNDDDRDNAFMKSASYLEGPPPKEGSFCGIQSSSPSDRQLSQAHLIQQAYREWCDYYGKTPDKDRLGIFASNFLAVKEYHEKTGRPLIMNEFSDMTEDEWREYQEHQQSYMSPSTGIVISQIEATVRVDDRIRRAYRQWCDHYNRVHDETRLDAFASNYFAVEKYHKQTNKALVLNQYADMTEAEYQNYLQTTAHFANTPQESNLVEVPAPRASSALPYDEAPNNPEPTVSYRYDASPVLVTTIPTNQLDQSGPTDETMRKVVSALQSTVVSLNDVARSLTEKTAAPLPVSSKSPPDSASSGEQPLDSLVIDVLKKQDDNIATLEDSVEGLRDIQEQSSGLIQLVSQNQMQMAEMMSTVQSEIAFLQTELIDSKQESNTLKYRVGQLEALFEVYKDIQSGNLSFKGAATSFGPESSTKKTKSITIEPNPIDLGMSMFTPTKSRSTDEEDDNPKTPNLENKRRPT